jgi:hypothetical protein
MDRRQNLISMAAAFGWASAAKAGASPPALGERQAAPGNPILPGLGVCDPQVRVYDGEVYLYATHDASPASRTFVMRDWWVWKSLDLVTWTQVSVLKPEQTYWGKPSTQCWATDAARRDGKYYFYFSRGPAEIGVVEGPSPAGPWRDTLGKPLIAKGQVRTEARDPGILQEPDGTSYIVFGVFTFHIARLNSDMSSLAETPRPIKIHGATGPYGPGKTDDKPFLHRRGDKYYLSWGCFYGVSDSPYGPYDCKGSIIRQAFVDPEFRNVPPMSDLPAQFRPVDMLVSDRHGSFFDLNGQSYFICNDFSQPGSGPYFRNSVLAYVKYRRNGEIAPVRLRAIGVGRYDALQGIEASDFFAIEGGATAEQPDGAFAVEGLRAGSWLRFPKVRNLGTRRRVAFEFSAVEGRGEIELRRGAAGGRVLARAQIPGTGGSTTVESGLGLCVVIRGKARVTLRRLTFA